MVVVVGQVVGCGTTGATLCRGPFVLEPGIDGLCLPVRRVRERKEEKVRDMHSETFSEI
jgi:hypothetical protein